MIDLSEDKPIQLALLIDDESFDQLMHKRIIQRSGFVQEIMGFQAADQALDYLCSDEARKVDVIFLDINMPRMNGFEFLERAGQLLGPDFAKVCIVMLTTSLNPTDQARAEAFDVVRDFLHKPLTQDDMCRVVDLVCEYDAPSVVTDASIAALASQPVDPGTPRPV